jgi:hypothetical protein
MRVEKRLSPEESNLSIRKLVDENSNFFVTRIGLGGETAVSALVLNGQVPNQQVLSWFFVNAGFYGSSDFLTYANLYKEACNKSDLHAYWNFQGFIELEDFLVPEEKTLIEPGSLESFRFETPWTKEFKDKKILIISPFKSTIDNQLLVKDKIWQNKDVLPEAEYITYKSVQSIGGKGPHKDWYESFQIMCSDISKIDFDIALLGCGSYGMPLGNYIKTTLKKSSIYVGGGLQLYFGIKGKRWDNSPDITKFYNEYWIRPSIEETPELGKYVEGGCYW